MEINIKDELKKLVELQEMDKKIFALIKEKEGQPEALAELQKEFDAKKAKMSALEDKKQKLLLRQKDREIELAGKEDAVKKAQGQLGQLKTNKEYQAKLNEIEGQKADKSLIEEDVLKCMDEVDVLKKAIEAERAALQGEEKLFNEKKGVISGRSQEIESRLDSLQGRRKIYSQGVDKKILAQYEHILHGKNGSALVRAENNSCQGCYMHVPHQVVNEIKMYDRLITCEVCSRILYLLEDVEV